MIETVGDGDATAVLGRRKSATKLGGGDISDVKSSIVVLTM